MSDRLPLREVDLLDVSSTSDDIFKSMVFIKDNKIKMLEEQLATKDKEIKRLQEQLARWQQTAISERARRIEAGLKLANIDGESWDDRMARARVLAAKELGLEQDASYIGRLETAYLLAKEESLWANHDVDDIVNSKQRAQAALAKIREGK